MNIAEALLDSWDRQCRIVDAIASRIDKSNRNLKPTEDGWPLYRQLAHIHSVRRFFLTNVAPEKAKPIGSSFVDGWETPIEDLDEIKALLAASAAGVLEAMSEALQGDLGQFGWYDNPVLFLQHMVWHEGWHVGLICTALRLAGQEPPEEWEETKIWGEWRTEEW